MRAFTEAAKRMFWPIVSSTATTLCAFLPMLFWPGVAGEFMGMLPVTLIFVLCASLIVALIYLPVMGGVAGRLSRVFDGASAWLRRVAPWVLRAALVPLAGLIVFLGAMQVLNPGYLFGGTSPLPASLALLPGAILFLGGAFGLAIALGSVARRGGPGKVPTGRRRTPFGRLIEFLVGNPVMPVVSMLAVGLFVYATFGYYGANNNGVEFFVESEPEQAKIYVRARGNLSLAEKDALLAEAEAITLDTTGVQSAFAFAGEGGLDSGGAGGGGPLDSIGEVQIELIPWDDRAEYARTHGLDVADLDGDVILAGLEERLARLPGIRTETMNLAMGPASGKPLQLRVKGDDWEDLLDAAAIARERFAETPGLIDIDDSTPLPGIDWEIDVDVEAAGRYGADVATVGGMIQLVTRGLLLDTMRVDSSDEEVDIRVRFPPEDRVLSTLDSLKLRTPDGLVPLSNFVTRRPVASLGQIDRIDQQRYFDIRADVQPGLQKIAGADGVAAFVRPAALVPGDAPEIADGSERFAVTALAGAPDIEALRDGLASGALALEPVNANERIALLTEWLSSEESPLPAGVSWEWTGDQEDQAESMAFLIQAFIGALGLMFIILLAQFNSIYSAILVLLAVVLSTTGSLIGMIVMDQPFSIIMTGTGIVALAGIVVNNNIVLIDTYQEYSRYMPQIEAIIRTAEDRIRPVLLTTITTMAGLAPMMLGLSFDFINGGYSVDSPTALWWTQLATAVVFGLGIATVLTLIFTPSALALRIWLARGAYGAMRGLSSLAARSVREDMDLARRARRAKDVEIVWDVADGSETRERPLRAAE